MAFYDAKRGIEFKVGMFVKPKKDTNNHNFRKDMIAELTYVDEYDGELELQITHNGNHKNNRLIHKGKKVGNLVYLWSTEVDVYKKEVNIEPPKDVIFKNGKKLIKDRPKEDYRA